MCDADDGVDVAAADVTKEVLLDDYVEEMLAGLGVGDCSSGKSSPGCSWSIDAESSAVYFCVAKLTEEF